MMKMTTSLNRVFANRGIKAFLQRLLRDWRSRRHHGRLRNLQRRVRSLERECDRRHRRLHNNRQRSDGRCSKAAGRL